VCAIIALFAFLGGISAGVLLVAIEKTNEIFPPMPTMILAYACFLTFMGIASIFVGYIYSCMMQNQINGKPKN